VVSFIRTSWGNRAAPVDAAQVAEGRRRDGNPRHRRQRSRGPFREDGAVGCQ